MTRCASLLAVALLASPSAWAGADSPADIRYCLEMKSNAEIAKCSGETSAGNKGRPFSRKEADKILEEGKPGTPIIANKPLIVPALDNGEPGKEMLPGNTESSGN